MDEEMEIDDFSSLIKGKCGLAVGIEDSQAQSQALNDISLQELDPPGPGRIAAAVPQCRPEAPPQKDKDQSATEDKSYLIHGRGDSLTEPVSSWTPERSSQLAPGEHIASLEGRLSTLEKLVCICVK